MGQILKLLEKISERPVIIFSFDGITFTDTRDKYIIDIQTILVKIY